MTCSLAADPARIDALFADLEGGEGPGCALAILRGDEIIYARGYGFADLEHRIAIRPESVFDIGSTSKQFTAACIVLLVLDGRLTLDDPVRSHIAELPDYGVPLTLRHLLHHTGGVRDYLTLMALADLPFENDHPAARITGLITRQRELMFTPGDEFLYSNSGYYLLGEVVRRVSGQSLARFAQERVFGPLGMQSTHFHDDWRRLVPHRAQGYQPGPGGGYVLDISLFDVVGDGGVYSTVLDLGRWSRVFTDASLLGGPAFLEAMLTVGVLNDGTALRYGAGLLVDGERISHGGAWAGYRAELLILPEEALSVVCLSNLATFDPTGRALEVLGLVRGSRSESEDTARSPISAEAVPSAESSLHTELAGRYWSLDSGRVWTVAADSEGLTVQVSGQVLRLEALALDTFTLSSPAPSGTRLVFGRETGTVQYTDHVGVVDVLQRSVPPVLDQAGLREYAGKYVSQELDISWQFEVEDGQLALCDHATLGGVWEALAPGVFWNTFVTVSFVGSHSGQPTGLVVNAGRVKNLHFQRSV